MEIDNFRSGQSPFPRDIPDLRCLRRHPLQSEHAADISGPEGRAAVPASVSGCGAADFLRVQCHHQHRHSLQAGGGLHPAAGNEKLPVEPWGYAGLVPGGRFPVLYPFAAAGADRICEHHGAPGGDPRICLRRDAEDHPGRCGDAGYLRCRVHHVSAPAVRAPVYDPGPQAIWRGGGGERPVLESPALEAAASDFGLPGCLGAGHDGNQPLLAAEPPWK